MNEKIPLNKESCLPEDAADATLVARAWSVGAVPGPSVVVLDKDKVYDITPCVATMSDLFNLRNPVEFVRNAPRTLYLGTIDELLRNSWVETQDPDKPYFISPCDLQSIKACGVTFIDSLLERVVEEKAMGDASRAKELRAEIEAAIGVNLQRVKPGSSGALKLKQELLRMNLWSQYLEVGIGEDAEVFSKAQPMSSIGFGAELGIHPSSKWNNPEPEVVLAVNARGRIVGCTLGNDVNLRDIEGRSALLLGKAKDNNGSCCIGPFIRLLDDRFTLQDVRELEVKMEVCGLDGFVHSGLNKMESISRDIEDLVKQVIGPHHQYPDALVLFTGTMYTPTESRNEFTEGFTHKKGDIVKISSPKLGALINTVNYSDQVKPWVFGITSLMKNLSDRGCFN